MLLQTALNREFTEAASRLAAEPIPIRTAFKLKKLIAQINSEVQLYHEVRIEKLRAHAVLDEQGDIITLEDGNAKMTPEGHVAFISEMSDLGETKLSIEPLSIDELGDITISVLDLTILEGLIV